MADEETLRGQVGEYRVYEKLASGGFASVCFGRDTANSIPVAIKRMHAHFRDQPVFVERFEQEAATVRGLRHPNIVQVLDHGRDHEGVPFIVMEWVEGTTISEAIRRRGRYSSTETAEVGCQVLEGLNAAWAHHVVHRDIKPANLMVTPDGRVKIMDFGLAKDVELATISGQSGLIGTPAYMAPEQLRGQPMDCRSDLYALGVTLFMMLAGRPPFEGPTFGDYLRQHLEQEPPELESIALDVNPRLTAVLHRALAKSPDDRYQSPAEMLAALRPLAVGAAADDVTVIAPDAPTVISDRTQVARVRVAPVAAPIKPKANRGWLLAAPVIIVVILGVAGFVYQTQLGPAPSAELAMQPLPAEQPGLLPPVASPMAISAATPTVTTPKSGDVLFDESLPVRASTKLKQSPTGNEIGNLNVGFNAAEGYVVGNESPIKAQIVGVDIPTTGTPDDAVLTLNTRIVGSAPNQFVVLWCRGHTEELAGAFSGYRLLVNPAVRQLQLERVKDGVATTILEPTMAASLKSDTFNQIELTCQGDTIIAAINGKESFSRQDPVYARGGLGIGVGAGGGGPLNAEAHFKELKATHP